MNCELCSFSETCTDAEYFSHLKRHLHNKETVKCPYLRCNFQSNVYSTFCAHKCRKHQLSSSDNFRSNLHESCTSVNVSSDNIEFETETYHSALTTEDLVDDKDLGDLLQHQFASLLLHMQTILHVSKAATQEIINELCNINLVLEEFTPKQQKTLSPQQICCCD